MKNKQTIGLFGFGVVGEGLFQVLKETQFENAEIVKICIKQKDKKRTISPDYFTTNANEILDNEAINLVVELIDNAEDAYKIVTTALKKGKSVVSGNKNMIAKHLPELIDLQKKHNVALLYDASACGSIPIIRNLEEYYDNDLLQAITGILNGSSNYILSKIFNENMDYHVALKQAQELGFAESNPVFDVEGYDSLYKLCIITAHGFGTIIKPEEVLNYGISNISVNDIKYAREKGYKIKLVAQTLKLDTKYLTLFVLPKLVNSEEYIYNVENEFNGVVIEGKYYDKQFMFGRGAGAFPTSSAVLSDITARTHNYKYEYKKINRDSNLQFTTNTDIKIYLRYANVVDFSHFEFESITERYSSKEFNYVVGTIKLTNLMSLRALLPKIDVFLAVI